MRVEIRSSNVPVSGALREHLLRKLDFASRRFERRVELVVVRLVDLNGPRGGPDKRCRISARLSRTAPPVVAEATDADAYVAVSQAVARLDERISRAVTRRQEQRTRGAAIASGRADERAVVEKPAQGV